MSVLGLGLYGIGLVTGWIFSHLGVVQRASHQLRFVHIVSLAVGFALISIFIFYCAPLNRYVFFLWGFLSALAAFGIFKYVLISHNKKRY
jgi:hypothetical protein